jgi:fatty-acyl-CoA synthase
MSTERESQSANSTSPSGLTRGPWLQGGEPRTGRIARAKLRSIVDIREVEKCGHEALLPGRTIFECIKVAAEPHPEKAAIICLRSGDISDAPQIISYAALVSAIERSANLFHEAAGDNKSVVGIVLPMLH